MDPLCTATMQALSSLGLFESQELCLSKEVCQEFFSAVEKEYLPRKDVPYHNARHACDVVQTVVSMIELDKLILPEIALLALITAASIHDIGHPGLNNLHLIATEDKLATRYNDQSVLENFHASSAFDIMRSDERFDILAGLRASGRSEMCDTFRSLVIEMVLATDMKHHFDQEAKLRLFLAEKRFPELTNSVEENETKASEQNAQKLVNKPIEFSSTADVSVVCSLLLHVADLSNVAKRWDSYKPWMDLLFEEFFAQGDLEERLGLDVQPMMNRRKCDPATAQIAFITKFVMPLYSMLSDVIPRTSESGLKEMEINVQQLQALVTKS